MSLSSGASSPSVGSGSQSSPPMSPPLRSDPLEVHQKKDRSGDIDYLLQQLNTRTLPLPKLIKVISCINRTLKKDHRLVSEISRHGSVPTILSYIEKPRISDLALSLLANCCMNEKVRSEVLKANGLSSLVRIMSNIAEDSIRNRACRAIANLALTARGAHQVHQCSGSILTIIDLLSTTQSKESQATAIRALKVLSSTTANRENLTKNGAPGCLARCLKTIAEPLQKPCLEALERLTHKCSLACAKQIKEAGVFELLTEMSETSDSALITMVNISHLDSMLVTVGSCGLIPKIINRLGKKDLPVAKYSYIFITLCRLCKEPFNLIRVRDNGGLELMVSILDNKVYKHLWTYSSYTLMQFKFDDTALTDLIKLRLMPILIRYVESYISDNRAEHDFNEVSDTEESQKIIQSEVNSDRSSCISGHSEFGTPLLSQTDTDTVSAGSDHETSSDATDAKKPKLFCLNSPSYQEIMQAKSLCVNYNCLPSQTREDYYGLPGYSGMSPRSLASPKVPDFDDRSTTSSPSSCTSPSRGTQSEDGAYSPIYDEPHSQNSSSSEDEEEKTFSFMRHFQTRVFTQSDSPRCDKILAARRTSGGQKRKISETTSDDTVATSPKEILLDHALRLFEIYTFPRSIDLLMNGASDVLIILIKYMNAIPDSLSRAEKAALVLASHRKFFKEYILLEIVPQILKLLDRRHSDCSRCFYLETVRDQLLDKLSDTADSTFGGGEIAHFLMTGDSNKHISTAVALGMIVHPPQSLHALLFDCGALDILFDGLQGTDEEIFVLCVRSLLVIGRSSGFRKSLLSLSSPESRCSFQDSEIVNPVSFVVKDGRTVTADKDLLLSKSDYFQAMLRNENFVEGETDCIKLPDVDEKSLKNILHCLACSISCVGNQFKDVIIAAEAMHLCHMFLLTDLEKVINDHILRIIQHKDVPSLYELLYPREDSVQLRLACVKLVLTNEPDCDLKERSQLIEKVIKSDHGGHFLEDIRKVLSDQLVSRCR